MYRDHYTDEEIRELRRKFNQWIWWTIAFPLTVIFLFFLCTIS